MGFGWVHKEEKEKYGSTKAKFVIKVKENGKKLFFSGKINNFY